MSVCTISTYNAIKDLKVFLFSLDLFNDPKPKVYLLCDTKTAAEAKALYSGELVIVSKLDIYGDLDREKMATRGGINYRTLWDDFMMEKATVIELALENEKSAYFCDSDICFLGPLPYVPANKTLAVNRHMIKDEMEKNFGVYNAGFLWTCDKSVPNKWRQAAKTSRYHDQTALEDVVIAYEPSAVYEFSMQNNFGWWRMYYTNTHPEILQKGWSTYINEPYKTAGIMVNDSALLSIHTHFSEEVNWKCTYIFNTFFMGFLSRVSKNPKARRLHAFIVDEFYKPKSGL